MLASGGAAAPGAPLQTVGGWETGAPPVEETPAFGAPLAAGFDLRFILRHYLGTITSSGMMDWDGFHQL